jgi:hypothetical protein
LDELQTEFDMHYPSLQIEIIGINQLGHEIGNPSVTNGRDIPWLQDVDNDGDQQSDVWLNSWPYEYRDVVIVDDDGGFETTYNLTKHDLSVTANYETLKEKFIDVAATEPLSLWQSPIEPLDVDASSVISPVDALLVINELGKYPPDGRLPQLGNLPYVDTDGDGKVSPVDALLVINQLNFIASKMAAQAAPMAAPLSAVAVATGVDARAEMKDDVFVGGSSERTSTELLADKLVADIPADPGPIEIAPSPLAGSRRIISGAASDVESNNNAEMELRDRLFGDLAWAAL